MSFNVCTCMEYIPNLKLTLQLETVILTPPRYLPCSLPCCSYSCCHRCWHRCPGISILLFEHELWRIPVKALSLCQKNTGTTVSDILYTGIWQPMYFDNGMGEHDERDTSGRGGAERTHLPGNRRHWLEFRPYMTTRYPRQC